MLTSIYLKRCKLWPGSNAEQEYQLMGIQQGTLERAIQQLELADDRTAAEDEWLSAMKATVNDPTGNNRSLE